MLYICNAFSLQMLNLEKEQNIHLQPLTVEEVKERLKEESFVSAIGHEDTANVLSNMLGVKIEKNRMNLSLTEKDSLIVAQLTGGRLPEGSTTLPEGFEFEFVKVTLL